jgi:hypothetical protein
MSYYIYKISCDDLPEFVYVGSTKAFRQRKRQHKSNCNNDNSEKHNIKLYQTIRENGGWENWRMVLIEECGEISFTQAKIKEEEHRVKLNANLNSQRCHQTEEEKKKQKKEWFEEWYQNNKEHRKEWSKEWWKNNKEKINKKNEELYTEKINCKCGGIYTYKHKARHFKTNKHLEYIESLEKD